MGQALTEQAAVQSNVPAKIGKYVIINKVGHGSTGNVYLSHDPYYRRDVAIKVYDIDTDGDDPERARVTRKMFFNEAHMVGMLQHPNILPIYDAGEEDGKYYVVTEYIQGARTLARYCKPDNLLRIDDVVEIVYKCAKALHYAHGRGVIHRDIKPSNVMLTTDNDVRIIDFGIAIVTDSDISQIRGIAGSPSYMSPEQVQSEDLTNRSDLYSLGAVMYELLTGFRPFRAGNLSKLLHQIVYATPQPIHRFRADVTEQLESIAAVALQKDPSKRYANGLALAAELTRVYKDLRAKYDQLDNQEHFDRLRQLRFFHEFSQSEIWEVLRAGDWSDYRGGDDIVKEGEIEDRFFIIVSGEVDVVVDGNTVGSLRSGDCFGETSYVSGAKSTASIHATSDVTVLKVGATLMEQMSSSCQLRFNKEFLRSLIKRLQR
ncbi:MAG: serine/threonine-protein kinase [Pseudomonadota bacterium]